MALTAFSNSLSLLVTLIRQTQELLKRHPVDLQTIVCVQNKFHFHLVSILWVWICLGCFECLIDLDCI